MHEAASQEDSRVHPGNARPPENGREERVANAQALDAGNTLFRGWPFNGAPGNLNG